MFEEATRAEYGYLKLHMPTHLVRRGSRLFLEVEVEGRHVVLEYVFFPRRSAVAGKENMK